jgi:hypothetical protein
MKGGTGAAKLRYLFKVSKDQSDALAKNAEAVIKIFSALTRQKKIETVPGLIPETGQQRQSPAVESALAKPPQATALHAQAVQQAHPAQQPKPGAGAQRPQAPAQQQTQVHAQASAPSPGNEEWRKNEQLMAALGQAADDGRSATVYGARVVMHVGKNSSALFNTLKQVAGMRPANEHDAKLKKGAEAILAEANRIYLSHLDPAAVEKEALEHLRTGARPALQKFDVAKFVAEFSAAGNGDRRLKLAEFNSEWERDPDVIRRLAALLAFTEEDGEASYAAGSAETVKAALEFVDAAGGTKEKRTAVCEAALPYIGKLAGSISVRPDLTDRATEVLMRLATDEEVNRLLTGG